MFIVFDGIDGAGKSTQMDQCQQWLVTSGHAVTRCADPGSTMLGLRLRELLLDRHSIPISAWSEALLFTTARAQMVDEIIQPALDAGQIVLCDRYIFSTVVYQGIAGGLSADEIWQINQIATQRLMPDLTILLDLPAETAMARWSKAPDRMESRGLAYFERVRAGFLTEARRWPVGVEVVDASTSPDEVQNQIQRLIEIALTRVAT